MNMKSWYRTSRLPRPFYFQEKKITFTPPKKRRGCQASVGLFPRKWTEYGSCWFIRYNFDDNF